MKKTLGSNVWDVLIVGAGLSGIGVARELQKQLPNLQWCIVESRHRMGGTWDLFRYPGVRSDSDKYTFGYGSRPWLVSNDLASGEKILRYIEDSATEAGVNQHIHYGLRVTHASWSSQTACWTLTLEVANAQEKENAAPLQVRTRYLHTCSGYYDYAQGTWIHPQFWPADLNTQGKRMLIIGGVATAIAKNARVVVGWDAKLLGVLERLAPVAHGHLLRAMHRHFY